MKTHADLMQRQAQQAFLQDDKHWFAQYKPYIQDGRILKIGYGLGYVTKLVQAVNPQIVSTDIMRHQVGLPGDVVRVDGEDLPFADKSFEVVICSMTLHHTRRPFRMLTEMARVTRTHIIVIDTTASQPIAYAAMVWACMRANQQAGQASTVLPWNYFTPGRIRRWSHQLGLREVVHKQEPRARGYYADLWVWQVGR